MQGYGTKVLFVWEQSINGYDIFVVFQAYRVVQIAKLMFSKAFLI